MTQNITWQQTVSNWFDSIEPGYAAYALIDLANVLGDKRTLLRKLQGSGALNVLGDNRPEAEEALPWLWPLSGSTDDTNHFELTLKWAGQSACVTWLSSRLPAHQLCHGLERRTQAELPDNYPILLRHFDPRVLHELVSVLNDEQAETFWALDGVWAYVDRARQLKTISLHKADPLKRFEAPLSLSQLQADQLLAAAEVDRVMPELIREASEQFLAIAPLERVPFTRTWLKQADDLQLTSFADRVLLAVLALKLGSDFLTQPKWQPLAVSLKKKQITLLQAIKQAS